MIRKIKEVLKSGSIRGDALQIYVYQSLTLSFGLVASIIIARAIGPEKKGYLDLFNLLNSLITEFGLMGFSSGLLYYLANKGKPLGEVHGTGLAFSLGMGFLTVLAGFYGLSIWKRVFPGLNEWIILISFFLAPASYYLLTWSNLMTGINCAVKVYSIGLLFVVFNFLFILFLWSSHLLTVGNIIVVSVLTAVINAFVGFQVLFKKDLKIRLNFPLAKASLRYGLIIYVGAMANVLHFKVDQIMINYWLGVKGVGIYAVSVRWAEVLFFLDSAITVVALYKIASSSPEESYALTKRLFRIQLIISGISGVLLAVLAYPLILILYGDAYREAVWPLILLIPGIVAWSVGKILSQYLSYNQGKFWFLTSFAMAGIFTNIILNFFLIGRFGISGAAIASSLSYGGVLLLVGIAYKKFQSVPAR